MLYKFIMAKLHGGQVAVVPTNIGLHAAHHEMVEGAVKSSAMPMQQDTLGLLAYHHDAMELSRSSSCPCSAMLPVKLHLGHWSCRHGRSSPVVA